MTDKDLTYIERYLLGELSESELNQFLNRMKTDSQFLIEVEKQKNLLDGISTYGNRELKTRLSKISADYSESNVVDSPNQSKKFNWKIILAAAAFILAFSTIVTVKYFMNNSTPNLEDNQELFAQYFNPIELSNTRSTVEQIDISPFTNGDYESAIPVLQEVLNANSDRTDIAIALSNSFFSIESTQKALQILTPIIERNDPIFSDQAKWYSALCFIRLGNEDKAIEYLNDLAQKSEADFNKEAKELIKALK